MILNIDEIREISYIGIRRAYVFMGLGINSANNESFIDYDLSPTTKYHFLPLKLTIDETRKLLSKFNKWSYYE